MKLSQKGLLHLQAFEGYSSKAYRCERGVLTIGFGHTQGVKEGDAISIANGEALLALDVEKFERGVLGATKGLTLSQGQFDALVCLSFNIGLAAFRASTLLKKLKAGDPVGAAMEFEVWNKVTVNGEKRVSSGLTRRRRAEQVLFCN